MYLPNKRQFVLVGILFIFFILIFYHRVFFQREVIGDYSTLNRYYPWKSFVRVQEGIYNDYFSDTVTHFLPIRQTVIARIKQGELPLWDSFSMAGISNLAIPYSGIFYPGSWLTSLFSNVKQGITYTLVGEQIIALVFTYLFVVSLGVSFWGGIFAALLFVFNLHSIALMAFPADVSTLVWFPVALYFYEQFRSKRKVTFLFLTSLSLTLSLLAGNLEIVLGIYFGYFIYVIFCQREKNFRVNFKNSLLQLSPLFLAVLLAAVMLVPFLSLTKFSQRTITVPAGVLPLNWITGLFPDFWGNEPNDTYILNMYQNRYSANFYLGILPVFFILFSFFQRENRKIKTIRWCWLVSGLVILLSPILGKILANIPVLNLIRSFIRLIFVFLFFSAILAADGVDGLFQGKKKIIVIPFIRRSIIGLVLFATFVLLCTPIFTTVLGKWWIQYKINLLTPAEKESISQQGVKIENYLINKGVGQRLWRTVTTASIHNRNNWLPYILVLLFYPLMLLFYRLPRTLGMTLLLACSSFDLFYFSMQYPKFTPPENIFNETGAIKFMQRENELFRLMNVHLPSGDLADRVAPFRMWEFYGLSQLGGYTSIYHRSYREIMNLAERGKIDYNNLLFEHSMMFTNYRTKIKDWFNVKYLLCAPEISLTDENLKLVYNREIKIYQNLNCLPRAYIVHQGKYFSAKEDLLNYFVSSAFNPRQEVVLSASLPTEFKWEIPSPGSAEAVKFVRYRANRVEIEATLVANGALVFSDNISPGWQVWVDGKKEILFSGNYINRTVLLTRGKHTVTYVYFPGFLRTGMLISGTTLLLFVFIVPIIDFKTKWGTWLVSRLNLTGQ